MSSQRCVVPDDRSNLARMSSALVWLVFLAGFALLTLACLWGASRLAPPRSPDDLDEDRRR